MIRNVQNNLIAGSINAKNLVGGNLNISFKRIEYLICQINVFFLINYLHTSCCVNYFNLKIECFWKPSINNNFISYILNREVNNLSNELQMTPNLI